MTIQLPDSFDHDVKPPASIRAPGSYVAVEMLPLPERVGSVLIPESVGEAVRPSVGVVIAHGDKALWHLGQPVPFPQVGTVVVVHPEDGCGYKGVSNGEIRVYGSYHEYPGEPMECAWWNSILCEVHDGMLRATVDTVILRPDKANDRTEGGVYLPDAVRRRSAEATVVSAGLTAKANGLREGDRVLYDPEEIPGTFQGHREDLDGLLPAPFLAVQLVIG